MFGVKKLFLSESDKYGKSKPTIAASEAGYVRLSLAVLLASHNVAYAVDVLEDKVKLRRQALP